VYQYELFTRASLVTADIVKIVDRVPPGQRFSMVSENQRVFRQSLHAGAYGLARSGAIAGDFIALPSLQPIWFRTPAAAEAQMPASLTDDVARSALKTVGYAVVCGFLKDREGVFGAYASEEAIAGGCSLWRRY
jgi:hypothetical protein